MVIFIPLSNSNKNMGRFHDDKNLVKNDKHVNEVIFRMTKDMLMCQGVVVIVVIQRSDL